jgi:hypothetical protein
VQVAVPLVWSFKLLMLILVVSDIDQFAKPKARGDGGQPLGNTGLAMNCCWFPGAGVVWLATALCGEMLIPVRLQLVPIDPPPHPAAAAVRTRAKTIRAGLMRVMRH